MNSQTAQATEYVDYNSHIHSVSHTVLSHDESIAEITERIIEDLHRVFSV